MDLDNAKRRLERVRNVGAVSDRELAEVVLELLDAVGNDDDRIARHLQRLQDLERDVLSLVDDTKALTRAVAAINQTTLALLRQLEKAAKLGLDTHDQVEKLAGRVAASEAMVERLEEVVNENAGGRHLTV
jgi:hypothetical protein